MGRVILGIVICIVIFLLCKGIAWLVNAFRQIKEIHHLKDRVTYLERDASALRKKIDELNIDARDFRDEINTLQSDQYDMQETLEKHHEIIMNYYAVEQPEVKSKKTKKK